MNKRRQARLNSLLKEVLSEVIMKDVKNPDVSTFVTVTSVEISNDSHHAKVFVSVIGDDKERQKTLSALESGAGYIGIRASKKVVMRIFPSLTFKLDTSVDEHMRIDAILNTIHNEKKCRSKELNENLGENSDTESNPPN